MTKKQLLQIEIFCDINEIILEELDDKTIQYDLAYNNLDIACYNNYKLIQKGEHLHQKFLNEKKILRFSLNRLYNENKQLENKLYSYECDHSRYSTEALLKEIKHKDEIILSYKNNI